MDNKHFSLLLIYKCELLKGRLIPIAKFRQSEPEV